MQSRCLANGWHIGEGYPLKLHFEPPVKTGVLVECHVLTELSLLNMHTSLVIAARFEEATRTAMVQHRTAGQLHSCDGSMLASSLRLKTCSKDVS